jgi:SAM-dependent methyltransferase
MFRSVLLTTLLTLVATASGLRAEEPAFLSTRITDPRHHACTFPGGYPYRETRDLILRELDLRAGDVVVDVGAGDGWWARQMAEQVGPDGLIHASEVVQKLVDGMKTELADTPQIRPYLAPFDGTDLPEDSCDLAFLSKVYHHLPEEGHVDYLRHLKQVVKPTGRLCIIERNPQMGDRRARDHAWPLGQLITEAEQAGWVAVRCELIRGTHHYLAIFAPVELFE